MSENNLRVSKASSMAFEDSDIVQQIQFHPKKPLINSRKYTLIHQSTSKIKSPKKVVKDEDKQYKCFNCFGQQKSCRVCGGKRYIKNDHPIISMTEQLFKKKFISPGSSISRQSSSKNYLGIDPKYQVKQIKQESFTVPQQNWLVCSKCQKQYQSNQKSTDPPVCNKCRQNSSTNYLQVQNDKRGKKGAPLTSRLRKISEQIDSEQGLSFIMKQENERNQKKHKNHTNQVDIPIRVGHTQKQEEQNIMMQSLHLLEGQFNEQEISSIAEQKSRPLSSQIIQNSIQQMEFNYSQFKHHKPLNLQNEGSQKDLTALRRLDSWKMPQSINLSLQIRSQNPNKESKSKNLVKNNNQSIFFEERTQQYLEKQDNGNKKGTIVEDYACDSCHIYPIKNKRFNCRSCQDYDLCQNCFMKRKQIHQHQNWEQVSINQGQKSGSRDKV